ncbi:hypothetical protein ACLB2K_059638 [Fragaria x ananassa]
MEGHDVNNDMTEIKRMFQQLVGEKGEPRSFDYEEIEDANKEANKALKKDIDNNFVDFLRVNAFIMQIPRPLSLPSEIDLNVWVATSTQNFRQDRSRRKTEIRRTRRIWSETQLESARVEVRRRRSRTVENGGTSAL